MDIKRRVDKIWSWWYGECRKMSRRRCTGFWCRGTDENEILSNNGSCSLVWCLVVSSFCSLNKTVLLHERKSHTARRAASTPLLSNPGGYPSLVGVSRPDLAGGTLWRGTPCLGLGIPHKETGTSHWESTWDQWKYYEMEMGYPPHIVDRLKA